MHYSNDLLKINKTGESPVLFKEKSFIYDHSFGINLNSINN